MDNITDNRIDRLFADSSRQRLLSVYFCAGATRVDDAPAIIRALQDGGVDMVEIGFPFSDPLADGVVIQEAATRALRNGMKLRLLFGQLAGIRRDIHIPLIIMGYLNPILHYGFERFCQQCVEVGIDGCIIPDLPFDDYERDYRAVAERYGLRVIMLITPETSAGRVRQIDDNTRGFIYMVSSASTTGAQSDFSSAKREYFARIAAMGLRNERMVGFGVSNKATFDAACEGARGAIVGSRFVTLLQQEPTPAAAVGHLLADLGR